MERSGAFNSETVHDVFQVEGVHYNEETKSISIHDNVSLSLKDIRNIQLAKAASLAAGEILIRESGSSSDDISHVVIAGAFGDNLDVDHFRELKFIPEFRNAEYLFLGNTSLKAAEKTALDSQFKKQIKGLRDKTEIIELSNHPDFNDVFMDSLNF